MGGCYSQEPNFNEYTSIFEILSKMESENKKISIYAERNTEEPNLHLKCLTKTNSMLQFLKNKPLYYIEDRLIRFKSMITRFYTHAYRFEVEEFNKTEEELQDFIFNMMDYYNGIRVTVSDFEKKNYLVGNSSTSNSNPNNTGTNNVYNYNYNYNFNPGKYDISGNSNSQVKIPNTCSFKYKSGNSEDINELISNKDKIDDDKVRLNTLERDDYLSNTNKELVEVDDNSNKVEIEEVEVEDNNYIFTFENRK